MSIDEINENDKLHSESTDDNSVTESITPAVDSWQRNSLDVSKVSNAVDRAKDEIFKVIIGQEEMIDLLLASLFIGGHVLVEGVPGVAKTLTAKLLSQTLDVGFSRLQFTPDLMPTDVVGTTIFNMKSSDFTFNPGPIFSNIILIDEINRAPAKTQSALFEVMEEYQVTVDGETYPDGSSFLRSGYTKSDRAGGDL